MLENFILIAVIGLIVGAAVAYIVKAKKSGKKCIGCPYGGSCSGEGGCKSRESGPDAERK